MLLEMTDLTFFMLGCLSRSNQFLSNFFLNITQTQIKFKCVHIIPSPKILQCPLGYCLSLWVGVLACLSYLAYELYPSHLQLYSSGNFSFPRMCLSFAFESLQMLLPFACNAPNSAPSLIFLRLGEMPFLYSPWHPLHTYI